MHLICWNQILNWDRFNFFIITYNCEKKYDRCGGNTILKDVKIVMLQS